VTVHLTGGQRHDLLGVGPLFERGALRTGRRGRPRWKPAAVMADKAYSAAWLLETLRRKAITPIIPSRSDQPENPDFDPEAYRGRNLVERLVGQLKRFRRVATRYDKLDAHYLAFVRLASVTVWLRGLGRVRRPERPAARGASALRDPVPAAPQPSSARAPSHNARTTSAAGSARASAAACPAQACIRSTSFASVAAARIGPVSPRCTG
jgi:transposase